MHEHTLREGIRRSGEWLITRASHVGSVYRLCVSDGSVEGELAETCQSVNDCCWGILLADLGMKRFYADHCRCSRIKLIWASFRDRKHWHTESGTLLLSVELKEIHLNQLHRFAVVFFFLCEVELCHFFYSLSLSLSPHPEHIMFGSHCAHKIPFCLHI